MSFEEIIAKGGFVVWVLLGYSLLALTIIIERFVQFHLLGRAPELDGLDVEGFKAAETAGQGPECTLIAAMLAASREGVMDLSRVATRVGSEQLQRMERGFRTLAILGNTAPLLGLLGTIVGMIKAFMVIEQAGGRVDAQALAGGIWEAMLTTGVGLAVAIPILLLLHLLEGMADRRAQSMRSCASLMLERLPHGELTPADDSGPSHHREGGAHAV